MENKAFPVKVLVLLSTFRGRTFLLEQIDSILKQNGVSVELLVRDDGSDDETIDLLSEIAATDSRVDLIKGHNIGVVGSFFDLLVHTHGRDADFIALADQDDIWPVERLQRQCAALSMLAPDQPGLCYGGFIRIDASGDPIDGEAILPPLPNKGALLSENEIPGCTMVLNRSACELVRGELPPPDRIFMHDWWLEQVICFTGTIVRVDDIVLHYRQHDGNLIGLPSNFGIWRDRLTRIRRLHGRHPLLAQVGELHRRFADRMEPADRNRVEAFLGAAGGPFRKRLLHAFSPGFRRARRSDDLFLRLLLLIGYFRSQPQ